MKRTRLAALLLALIITGSAFAACSSGEDKTGPAETRSDVTTASEATEAPAETAVVYSANIPDEVDYEGRDFNMMVYNDDTPTWSDVDFKATEETGETINDACYRRTSATESNLGVKIVRHPVANYGKAPLQKSVSTDSGDYDAGFVYTHGAVSLAEEGILTDLTKVPGMMLDAPWWDQNAVNDLSIDNRLFMLTGDISIMYKKSIRVVYYNKHLAGQYTLANPYELMDGGKWTFDAMYEMSKSISDDLDGDGDRDEDDRYGFLYSIDTISLGLIASEVSFAEKDEDDLPYLSFWGEHTQQVWEKYTSLLYNKDIAGNCSVLGWDGVQMFIEDKGLFVCVELHNIERMREMANDFGVLPMPLFTEAQKEYHSTINPHVAAMLVIPTTNTDYEFTTHVLNDLGANSKNILTPAYYEKYLKGKGTRDDESEASLDIIFGSIRYDLGYAYNWGSIGDMPLNLVRKYDDELASNYQTVEKRAQKALEKTLKNYAEMD